jgi:predicted ArsR family transcriptional regulator
MRRKIMILAEEAKAREETVTAKGMADKLHLNLNGLSYHVKELAKAGALEVVGGEQLRGAWQKHYLPTEAFQATMTDTVALDQIAELVEEGISFAKNQAELFEIVRATGRPVEA